MNSRLNSMALFHERIARRLGGEGGEGGVVGRGGVGPPWRWRAEIWDEDWISGDNHGSISLRVGAFPLGFKHPLKDWIIS